MSGHSKWASIKHKKAAADAKRAGSFTKLANDITVAARRGGGDQSMNPTLRTATDKARSANMPKDNIERAVKRGTGELGGAVAEELLFEGFGPGNVPMLVEALSDNRNRTTPDVRQLFLKNGGRFAEGGGVAFQFTRRGVVRMDVPTGREGAFEDAAIGSGAEDYRFEDGTAELYAPIPALHAVRQVMEAAGFNGDASIEYAPNAATELSEGDSEALEALIEALEEYDDVTAVYAAAG